MMMRPQIWFWQGKIVRLRFRPPFPWILRSKINKFTHFDAAPFLARERMRLLVAPVLSPAPQH
jgi:hypothetical protein